jgi:hypothetical protein
MTDDTRYTNLHQRAQRAHDELAALQRVLEETQEQARELVALARQIHPAEGWSAFAPADSAAELVDPLVRADPLTDTNPHALAMEALCAMCDLIEDFPLEWQMKIVKALTAHTMQLVGTRLHRRVTPSA